MSGDVFAPDLMARIKWDGLYAADVWIGGAFAVVVFLLPLLLTGQGFIRQMRSGHYSELDRIYMDILRMGIDMAYLRDPQRIGAYVAYLKSTNAWRVAHGLAGEALAQTNGEVSSRLREEALQYDAYAFIVFNFLETIHDRCDENKDWRGRPDPRLKNTWQGIIGDEYRLHGAWFDLETIPVDGSRSTKFCLGFAQFMWDRRWNDARWDYLSERAIRAKHADKFLGGAGRA